MGPDAMCRRRIDSLTGESGMALSYFLPYSVDMADSTHLDRHGRVVLPAAARRALGLSAGDELAVEVRDGVITLRTFATSAAVARSRVREALGPEATAELADDLLEQRRRGLWRE